MDFSKLTFERIKEDIKFYSANTADSYLSSYPEFISYFQQIRGKIEKHHLIISSHFIYGWMPTVLKLNTTNLDYVLELLNDVKAGRKVNVDELNEIKKCVNNSVVGTSKLLHFIKPEVYAIWDSRVLRYIKDNKPGNKYKPIYGIDDSNNYEQYLNWITKIVATDGFNDLQKKIESTLDYKITPLRAIEVIMFQADKNKNGL